MPVITIPTDSDCLINSAAPTTVDSTGTVCYVGTVEAAAKRRSILRFPAASLAGLTSWDIVQAIWRPYVTLTAPSSSTFYFSGLDRDSLALDFNDMSWTNADQSGAVPWFSAGGDVDGGTPVEHLMPTGAQTGLQDFDVTSVVQYQLDNIGSHNYLAFHLMKVDESVGSTNFRFATIEHATEVESSLVITIRGDTTLAGRNLAMWGDN